MSANKHEVSTEFPRASSRHAAPYAERPRLVRGRENDAAADRNRLAAQARVAGHSSITTTQRYMNARASSLAESMRQARERRVSRVEHADEATAQIG